MALSARPISFAEACAFVDDTHRHHRAPRGHKISIGAVDDGELVGVIIIGRPVNRHRDDGTMLEVTRLATNGHPNACSFLYGRAAKIAFAWGYTGIGTYIRAVEPGTSLKAAGWQETGRTRGRSWDCASRPRQDRHVVEDRRWFERKAS